MEMDNAPQPDGEGHHSHRRDDDQPRPGDTRKVVTAQLHVGRRHIDIVNFRKAIIVMAATCTALVVLGTFVLQMLGWRLVSDTDDIKEVRALVDTLEKKSDRNFVEIRGSYATHSARLDTTDMMVRELREAINLWSFIQCVQTRRDNPDLLPPGCQAVMRSNAGAANRARLQAPPAPSPKP